MTRKDVELIAEIIRKLGYPQERRRIAEEFARKLSYTNPSFNRERFLRACGVEG